MKSAALIGMAFSLFVYAEPSGAADILPSPDKAVPAVMQSDQQVCADEARLIGVSLNMSRTNVTAPGGQLIGMIVGAGFSATLTPKARSDYLRGCLQGRGRYGATPPSENSAILPQLKREPMTFGSVRLDPNTLSVANGVINEGEKVLAGNIGYRKSAVVRSDVSAFPLHISRGSLAYAVVSRESNGVDRTYWCGRGRYGILGIQDNYCVWADNDGYVFYRPDAPSGLIVANIINYQTSKQSSSTYSLDENSTVPSPPMDIVLVVKKIGVGGIRLVAQANINGRSEEFWSGDVLFDDDGKAILPSWTSRISFQRSGSGLIAALTSDGDGKGWETVPLLSAN